MSETQKRALKKLNDKWQCPYSLQEIIPTLDCLVGKGLAERRITHGYLAMPRTSTFYKKKGGK